MESNISIFFIIEIIGTVAFASSGALVAIKQRLDLLGVVVLGVTTAVGGGMLRDILLGIVPPSLFMNPVYVYTAFLTAMVLFILVWLNQQILESRYISAYEKMMNLFDAIGLGAFSHRHQYRRDSRLWGISFPFHLSGRPHRRGRRYPERYTGRPVPVYPAQACVCLRLHCRGRVLCMP